MAKRKRRIPKAFVLIDKSSRTKSLQDKSTGRMQGRIRTRSPGDKTHNLRVFKGPFSGQIVGRTPSISVRGSRRARGTLRRKL